MVCLTPDPTVARTRLIPIRVPKGETPRERAGLIAIFEQTFDEKPPETTHGTAAVVDVTDARTMWQSIQRHFDEIPGIEKVGYAEWDADPAAVL